ncbi:MAG: DNA repair protein RecN [Deltaproteobacteria bacterium]|nr:DNA repair protein RecN [Deltaproteobacteria bacterium]
MLQELSIRNFAIIDDLSVSFTGGLTVMTGETGAGKSIIINAVTLLLGRRATAKLIRTGAQAAELEALFAISPNGPISDAMVANGLAPDERLLIRRVISRQQSHRIYINGRLATIQMLSQITENLASIAGQHAHQSLLKSDHHLLVLDRFGGLMPLRHQIQSYYHEMLPLIDKLKSLESIRANQAAQMELLFFQKNEIQSAAVSPGEDESLNQERVRLKNAALLVQTTHECLDTLYRDPGAAGEQISSAQKAIEKMSSLDPALTDTRNQLAELSYQIEDVVQNLQSYLNQIELDDRRLEAVESRLDTLNKLKRKYGESLVDVMAHLETIERKLTGHETIDTQITETTAGLSRKKTALAKLARELSQKRLKAARHLSRKVVTELSTLSMPNTKFEVELNQIEAKPDTDPSLILNGMVIHETGIDQAGFMIAPNAGETLKPLAGIASGGELSRVVLALKAILADKDAIESIVFDEVDVGIGGSVAEMVGDKLSGLSRHHQIICITHLPQIAKFGDHHYRISKYVKNGRTFTQINAILAEDRVQEIARMLGGMNITQTSLEHARELLSR